MSHSQRLNLREIRAVYQLLGEVTELGLQPGVWRWHMLKRLCELTQARVGITLDLKNALPGEAPQPLDGIDIGFDGEGERRYFVEYMKSVDWRIQDPSVEAMAGLHRKRRFLTRTREQLIDSQTWYASPIVSEARRGSNVDHFLASSAQIGRPGWTTGFILYRSWGDPAFRPRSAKLAQLFHLELLRRIWPTGRFARGDVLSLPRHQRLVLRGLLCGSTADEIARSLRLAPSTVTTYTRDLYRRLGVNSRGQLSSHFLNTLNGRPIFLPHDFEA